MKTVGELCIREVVIIRKDETVLEAARRMRAHHVGDLVVVEEAAGKRQPVAILTDRDIVVGVLALDAERIGALLVGDVVFQELVTVREDVSVLDTLKRMRGHGVRRLPVVNASHELIGIVAFDDLVELVAEQLNDLVQLLRREHEHERELRVSLPGR